MGLLLVIYGFFNSTIGEKMNEIQIIEAVLKEARIKVSSTFEQWLKGKQFVNLETKQKDSFDKLPENQQSQIKLQYEKDETERVKQQEEKKKELKNKPKNINDFEDYEYWTKEKTWSSSTQKRFERLLQKQLKLLAKDGKSDFGDQYEDVVPDLAENFLFSYPFVKNYLNIKGIKDHKGYIMDMLPK